MKKLFALCTALALLAALSACGGSPSGANSQAPADTQPSQSAQPAGTGGESGGVITIQPFVDAMTRYTSHDSEYKADYSIHILTYNPVILL